MLGKLRQSLSQYRAGAKQSHFITAEVDVLRSFSFLALFIFCSLGHASNYEVLAERTFNTSIFTQGLFSSEGVLYVSSGGYGTSFIAKIDSSGNFIKAKKLKKTIFAEGLTLLDDTLYLLSWKAGKLFHFDAQSLEHKAITDYQGQGWGLTHSDTHFLMSNGSDKIQIKDFVDFRTEKTIQIKDGRRRLRFLNELEFAKGYLWANVWYDNHIYKIDPNSGKVIQKWDLSPLRRSLDLRNPEAVLNGIAYESKRDAFWITGKLWPKRFLIKFQSSKLENQNPDEKSK